MNKPAPTVAQVRPDVLKDRLDRGEPLALLDVREDDERLYCALPAPPSVADLHVPMGEIQARFDEIIAATAGRPVVVYCHHGVRSMVVAAWLSRLGVPGIENLEGGVDAWSERVDPSFPRY